MALKWAILLAILAAMTGFFTSNYWIIYLRKPPKVEGFFKPEFRPVAELFRKNLNTGFENGGSFAAYVNGELVVDLWGGYTDYELDHTWKNYTIGNVASVTKFVAAVTFAKLVEKGYARYDQPVSDFWPEFAQNGKDEVTVRMLLSHQAGLVGLTPGISTKLIRDDWEKVEEILAQQKPMYKPGSAIAYHAYTYGLYVDALARKVDPQQRRLYKIFAEDIAKPFAIDFSISVPKSQQYRVARESRDSIPKQLWDAVLSPDYHSLVISMLLQQNHLVLANNKGLTDGYQHGGMSDSDALEIPYCSGQGYGTARALAKLTGILANGGLHQGKQLLKTNTVDDFSKVVASGYDSLLMRPAKRGAGVWIVQNPKGEEVVGHPGFGGQMAYFDRKNRVGLAYITNHYSMFALGDDPRFKSIEEAFYKCLSKVS